MKEEPKDKKFDLEDRLIEFGAVVVKLAEELPNSKAGNYIAGQLIRSGLSPALNYGEAQSAESRADFIHKFKVILKELRESLISLKVIRRLKLVKSEKIEKVMDETQQLIAIFVKSIETAQKNKGK
ncbi:MAG TPA: four helix bundle protein [Bacteroidota bacterium]|nr:four helix bundle protein [Bacteroidota bacterium]